MTFFQDLKKVFSMICSVSAWLCGFCLTLTHSGNHGKVLADYSLLIQKQ